MATAKAYDEFEDVGLSFTEEEVREWSPSDWADDRVARLIHLARACKSRADQPVDKEEFWRWCQNGLTSVATWYCHALQLPGVVRSEDLDLSSLSPSQKKKLRAEALRMGEEWIYESIASSESALVYVVTIGRRATSSPVGRGSRREFRSLGNRLANSVKKELEFFTKAEVRFRSLSS